jgi:plasmid maintenance system antidote protein VapI
MKTSKTHGAPLQQDLELSRVPAADDFPALTDDVCDIADDADVKVSELLSADIEELTVRQTARVLGIDEEKVHSLINDKTLCRSRQDAFGKPVLDAACVRAQAGVTREAFLSKVRRLITTEKNMQKLVDVPQAALDELILESEADMTASSEVSLGEHHQSRGEAAITIQNVNLLVDNLASATLRLEALMYRAGYLEAKVENLEEQLKVVPDLRTKAAQGLILERENRILQLTIGKHESELLDLHQLLAKLRQNWFCRSWCWMFGVKI